MPDHDYLKTVTIGAPETPKDTIVLCDYDPHWPALYAQEHVKIARALAGQSVRIEHVGSTSVPELCAKPIIDILLLVDDAASEDRYAPALEAAGYTLRVREPDWYEHRMFKGQSPTVISTCSVRAATKHSACWPSATICAAMPLTANATPQKSAGSPRRNGRTFRITPTPRQLSCRRSWRTFPLCR